MTVSTLVQMMARYNAWANLRLYDAAQAMPDEEYRRDRGAFFGSLHGTLNHILVGDRIWMRRFTGEGFAPSRLDDILFADLPALRRAREAEDRRIVVYADSLDEDALRGRLRYRTVSNPREIEQDLDGALMHFFNHQTHHRGQAHCLLTQIAGDAPSFDLIVFQRESGIGRG